MNHSRLLDLAALATLVALRPGCSTTPDVKTRPPAQPATAAATTPAPAAPTRPKSGRAPVVVQVVGPAHVTPGQPVTLKLIIERTVKGTPLFLKIALPPGTTLASGQIDERIDDDADQIERTVVLNMVGATPPGDVQVAVDTGAEHFGAHATAAYRFGRPAPLLPVPARTGAPLIINGHDFGASIPVEAAPPPK